MTTPYWSPDQLGCIDRDSFRLKPTRRTVLTTVEISRTQSKKGDVRAPLTASFTVNQNRGQQAAMAQWVRFDLAGGALPFIVNVWLWNISRPVRARMMAPLQTRQIDDFNFATSGTFEIERESIQ